MSDRSKLSNKSLELLEPIIELVNGELRDYWPLTLRQLYYQLVSALLIENSQKEYRKLSRMLSQARIEGRVAWEAIEDRSRTFEENWAFQNKEQFVWYNMESFLKGYELDLMQNQNVYIEVWLEKDALSGIVGKVCSEYCIPLVVARGFSSVSFKNDCRNRIEGSDKESALILYFGDFDPSGYEMLPTTLSTLKYEFGVWDVEGIQCALTPEHVDFFELPYDPAALKMTDSRAKKFLKKYGRKAVELDALPPKILEQIVRTSIENNIDMETFNIAKKREKREKRELRKQRKAIKEKLAGEL